jgi:hypothetical protein
VTQALVERRDVFEAGGVFPPALIDGQLRQLEAAGEVLRKASVKSPAIRGASAAAGETPDEAPAG